MHLIWENLRPQYFNMGSDLDALIKANHHILALPCEMTELLIVYWST